MLFGVVVDPLKSRFVATDNIGLQIVDVDRAFGIQVEFPDSCLVDGWIRFHDTRLVRIDRPGELFKNGIFTSEKRDMDIAGVG